jgi:hypothetical protein
MSIKLFSVLVACNCLTAATLRAEIKLPAIIGDHMVSPVVI